jgi:hypothetical protein
MIIPYTLRKKTRGYRVKLTQRLDDYYNVGHFYYVIEDKRGSIMMAGSSTGGVPDRVMMKDLDELFERWWRDRR